MTGNGTVSHGSGSNLANDPAPSLPIEPIRREDPDAFRERMAAKGARQRRFAEDTVKGYAAREEARLARRDDEAADAHARFTAPDLAPEIAPVAPPVGAGVVPRAGRTRPVPGPRAAAPIRSVDDQDRLAAITAYVQGDTIDEIMGRLHRGYRTVREWLVEAGVEIRPPHRGRAAGPTAAAIRPCAGPCGRLTRPSSRSVADHPGTVSRARDGLCAPCAAAASRAAIAEPNPTPSRPPAAPSSPAPLSSPSPTEPDHVPAPAPLAPAAQSPRQAHDVAQAVTAQMFTAARRHDLVDADRAARAAIAEISTAVESAAARWQDLALARDMAISTRLGMLRAAAADLLDLITDQPERNAS